MAIVTRNIALPPYVNGEPQGNTNGDTILATPVVLIDSNGDIISQGNQDGTPISGIEEPSGGTGIIKWLSAIYDYVKNITNTLQSKVNGSRQEVAIRDTSITIVPGTESLPVYLDPAYPTTVRLGAGVNMIGSVFSYKVKQPGPVYGLVSGEVLTSFPLNTWVNIGVGAINTPNNNSLTRMVLIPEIHTSVASNSDTTVDFRVSISDGSPTMKVYETYETYGPTEDGSVQVFSNIKYWNVPATELTSFPGTVIEIVNPGNFIYLDIRITQNPGTNFNLRLNAQFIY
jgi:hypothetical protein